MWRVCGGVVLGLVMTAFVAVGPATADPSGGVGSAAIGTAVGTEGLTPDLAAAYTQAEQEAHRQGVPLWITSGYRSWPHQQMLYGSAVVQYGGSSEAQRWVLPPERSTHVSGTAIDVGPYEGAVWLEANGPRWGLCRTYANEWWHFERVTTPGGSCPPMIADASLR